MKEKLFENTGVRFSETLLLRPIPRVQHHPSFK